MKIATWNINSVRARVERLCTWLRASQPDVLFLQELKCTDEQFPRDEVKAAGYHAETFGQKTYNGVAILSREPVRDVARGMNDGVDDDHARVIWCTVKGVRICGLYAPNGQAVGSPAYVYKLEWYARLTKLLQAKHAGHDLLLCGDFNVAPEEIDVWDPRYFADKTLFTQPERTALKALMAEAGLTDAYRLHHTEGGKFSWWDYRLLAFPKNTGLRIDHFLLSSNVAKKCTAAEIDREARKGKQPSDHAPVWVELAL
ncbi:MAG: exodeoxyribonuclease III [Archangiaceae bacterium]|nr:exodeoxyribonuclease III [Archangiaceae bacterium]